MVNGAVSLCNPLVERVVPLTLSVVLVVAVEVAVDGLRVRMGDDVLEIEIGGWLLELMLNVESVVVEEDRV